MQATNTTRSTKPGDVVRKLVGSAKELQRRAQENVGQVRKVVQMTPPTERFLGGASEHPLARVPVKLRSGVIAQDFNWGAIFSGTKAHLIKAGFAPKEVFGKYRHGKEGPEFCLPLNWVTGYDDACYGVNGRKTMRIPQRWNARLTQDLADKRKGIWQVFVEFDVIRDLNLQERANIALEALDRGDPKARDLVAQIPPCPLTVAVPAIIADLTKKYGKVK
jgi:hypothetical protein